MCCSVCAFGRGHGIHDADQGVAATGTVRAHGTVREVIYLGAATHTIVDLDQGDSLIVQRQNDSAPEPGAGQRGTTVHLTWRRDHCVPVDATA